MSNGFSAVSLFGLSNPSKKWVKKFVGVTGIRVKILTAGDSFPTIRPNGQPLVETDYCEVDASALPFTIGSIEFTHEDDVAIYQAGSWKLRAGVTVESTEVNITDKSVESISQTKETQKAVNAEFVDNFNNFFLRFDDLDGIAVANIKKRVYEQTQDTTARDRGLYRYDFDSTEPDKWVSLGGATGYLIIANTATLKYNKTINEIKKAIDKGSVVIFKIGNKEYYFSKYSIEGASNVTIEFRGFDGEVVALNSSILTYDLYEPHRFDLREDIDTYSALKAITNPRQYETHYVKDKSNHYYYIGTSWRAFYGKDYEYIIAKDSGIYNAVQMEDATYYIKEA